MGRSTRACVAVAVTVLLLASRSCSFQTSPSVTICSKDYRSPSVKRASSVEFPDQSVPFRDIDNFPDQNAKPEPEGGIMNRRPFDRETPDLISTSLEKLDEELMKIAASDRTAWEEALRRCPGLTGKSHRLLFLRSEQFRADDAAKKLVKYWDKRIELFGETNAFEPLTLNGILKDDGVALSQGVWRLAGKDSSGRNIIFADPSRHEKNAYDLLSMTRANWYVVHAAIEDDVTQREGLVFISYPKNLKLSQLDAKLLRMSLGSEFLPIHIAGFHICHPPKIFSVVFSVIKRFLGKENLSRLQVHSGSEDAVVEELCASGIPRESIPTDMGGNFRIDHDTWLDGRRSAGL